MAPLTRTFTPGSQADIGLVTEQVFASCIYWVTMANQSSIYLTFVFLAWEAYDPTVSTRYEPITHSSNDDYLWVNDVMSHLGYGAAPITPENVYTKVDQYNLAQRAWLSCDAAYSVFIAYNPAPAPIVFANGYRAYAMIDGPFVQMMYNSAGWGPNNISLVLTPRDRPHFLGVRRIL
jgi:hypothetical protein